ncbi:glycosyl transferase [Chromatiales bacterium (ex Bugula neritina AB1)]|nr:glycosyl transferase [Chromatiales bacterium (ex Bugula neritina AB1)]
MRTACLFGRRPIMQQNTNINSRKKEPRVAIVHDWLPLVGGAERVLEQLLVIYPQADVFTLFDFVSRDDAPFLKNVTVTTSLLQKIPFAKRYYRNLLPLFPFAIEQFDLNQYDLVISSSSAVAKGIITSPDQLHVCYCHSPMRYAWDLQEQYLAQTGLNRGIRSVLVRYVLFRLRIWDVVSSNRVDCFIANSNYIRSRISKTYRRDSKVIHPPVDIDSFQEKQNKEDFYLAASRQVPYKRIDLIVESFKHMPDKKLVVIGDGPEHKKIKALAGDNVKIIGHQPEPVLIDYLQRARAFIFAAQEDFGILPVEAQACGTPVIAFGRGGARETVLDKFTGLHFNEQTTDSLVDAVARFERLQGNFRTRDIRIHAESFSAQQFRQNIKNYMDEQLASLTTRSPGSISTDIVQTIRNYPL